MVINCRYWENKYYIEHHSILYTKPHVVVRVGDFYYDSHGYTHKDKLTTGMYHFIRSSILENSIRHSDWNSTFDRKYTRDIADIFSVSLLDVMTTRREITEYRRRRKLTLFKRFYQKLSA